MANVNINAGEVTQVRLKDQGSNPSAPASTYKLVFAKADGLYVMLSSGVVIGPLVGTNGVLPAALKIGDGGSTNYLQIGTDGTVTLVGTAKVWDDLRVEPNVRQAVGTGVPAFEKYFDDAPGTSKGVFLYSFTDEAVAGNEKELFFTLQMPHTWAATAIKPHVHFVPASTVNGSDIIWGLEYTWAEPNGGSFGDTTIVYSSTTLVPDDANITAGKHYIATFSAITPTSNEDGLSTVMICRIFRNSSSGSDTYTDKVGLLFVDFHYEINTLGSDQEYVK